MDQLLHNYHQSGYIYYEMNTSKMSSSFPYPMTLVLGEVGGGGGGQY